MTMGLKSYNIWLGREPCGFSFGGMFLAQVGVGPVPVPVAGGNSGGDTCESCKFYACRYARCHGETGCSETRGNPSAINRRNPRIRIK